LIRSGCRSHAATPPGQRGLARARSTPESASRDQAGTDTRAAVAPGANDEARRLYTVFADSPAHALAKAAKASRIKQRHEVK